ncbi:MAG: NAD-dependent epimerase/dehydratase family protein, partial [Candidatus Eisenbacteria bacterium]|nr:NAD-dependent epimerase/dehydratase family protein [Candidatus Eisenbacteria bacterium]
MIVLLTGAGGLIGRRLGRRLAEAGHEVRGLSRDPRAAAGRAPWAARLFPWSGAEGSIPGEALAGVDAIVHLAGESVSGRWTRERRRAIRASRVAGTRALVAAIGKRLDRSPATAAGGNGREDRDGGEGCKDGEDRDRGEGCKDGEDRDRGEGCKGDKGWGSGEAAQTRRSGVLVSASAVGYYGDRGEEELDEEAPPGEGFLAEVCREWEAEAR